MTTGDTQMRILFAAGLVAGLGAIALSLWVGRRGARDAGLLRSRADTVRAMLERVTDAIVAADATGTVQYVNATAVSLLGLPPGAGPGRPVEELLRGERVGGGPLLPDGQPDGAWFASGTLAATGTAVSVSSGPAEPGDPSSGRLYILRDGRSEVSAERMKAEILDNVSHELRTPLTAIKGYAGILQHPSLPDERREDFVGTIAAQAESLERVVDLLVGVASVASLSDDDAPTVAVAPVAREVVARWKGRLPGRRISCAASAAAPPVAAHPAPLAKAIDQLIDNAVKFSPDGGPVSVRVTAEDGIVSIAVRDRGIGLDEVTAARIGEAFRQGDGSSTRRFGGLGLGLAYVKGVAAAYGGRISLAPAKGGGTVATLRLPAAVPARATERV